MSQETLIRNNSFNAVANSTSNDIVGVWGDASKINYIDDYVRYNRGLIVPIYTDDEVIRPGIPYDPKPSGEYDPDPSTPGIELNDRPQSEWTFPVELRRVFHFTANGTFYMYEGIQYANRTEGYINRYEEFTGTYTIDVNGVVTLNSTAAISVFYSDLQNRFESSTGTMPTRYFQIQRKTDGSGIYASELIRQPDGSFQPTDTGWTYAPADVKSDLNGDGVVDPNDGVALGGTLRDDYLVGTNNGDALIGKQGNDLIVGNGGMDTIQGGMGSDRIGFDVFDPNSVDTITDFNPAEDILVFNSQAFAGLPQDSFIAAQQFHIGKSSTTTAHRFIYDQQTGRLFFDADGTGAETPVQIANLSPNLALTAGNIYAFQNLVTVKGLPYPTPIPLDPVDPVPSPPKQRTPITPKQGTPGPDRLIGSPAKDILIGLDGHDKLIGLNNHDQLNGGNGNDKLKGGKGNDSLWGGAGNDVLFGNQGRDKFALEVGAGRDVIKDFKDRQDKLGLTPGLTFRGLDITQRGNKTLISAGQDLLAILVGVQASQLTASDFTRMPAG